MHSSLIIVRRTLSFPPLPLILPLKKASDKIRLTSPKHLNNIPSIAVRLLLRPLIAATVLSEHDAVMASYFL